jgi:hypothetical protein
MTANGSGSTAAVRFLPLAPGLADVGEAALHRMVDAGA